MYGPIGACRRNLTSANCRPRSADHNRRSASVKLFRNCLARLMFMLIWGCFGFVIEGTCGVVGTFFGIRFDMEDDWDVGQPSAGLIEGGNRGHPSLTLPIEGEGTESHPSLTLPIEGEGTGERTVAPTHRSTVAPTHRSTVAPTHRSTVAPSYRPTVPSILKPFLQFFQHLLIGLG
jgi:hypothetical protein